MLCPNCGQELREVKGVSHYGSTIKLNQCNNCGGIWFDEWSLFSLEEKEVERLENIEVDKFRESNSNKQKEKLCPVCHLSLTKFRDPNIPESINIESCQKCHGFWMNHGETTKYKKYQEQKIKEGFSKFWPKNEISGSAECESVEFEKRHYFVEICMKGSLTSIGRIWEVIPFVDTKGKPISVAKAELEYWKEKDIREREYLAKLLEPAERKDGLYKAIGSTKYFDHLH